MAVVRWTDEMIDSLVSSVVELRESMQQSNAELRESARESNTELKDSIDGLRVTAQALLQIAAQSQRDMEKIKERQAESDQRFNVLLEEVRFLNRGNRNLET